MARPREHTENTRNRLLLTAGELLAREGPAALSLRRVAELAGTSTQAIYTLFDGKPGLVRAMYLQGFATLDRHLLTVEPRQSVREELCELALAYRASALAQPHFYHLMFSCPLPEFAPSESDQQQALLTLERLRAAVLRHAAAFGDQDPEDITFELWALAHGLASLELQGALDSNERAERHWLNAFRAAVAGYCQ